MINLNTNMHRAHPMPACTGSCQQGRSHCKTPVTCCKVTTAELDAQIKSKRDDDIEGAMLGYRWPRTMEQAFGNRAPIERPMSIAQRVVGEVKALWRCLTKGGCR